MRVTDDIVRAKADREWLTGYERDLAADLLDARERIAALEACVTEEWERERFEATVCAALNITKDEDKAWFLKREGADYLRADIHARWWGWLAAARVALNGRKA